MARKNKKETLGNYICKVGYLDIYQKFNFNRNGKAENSFYRIVHAKHVILEKINTIKDAKQKAEKLVIDKIKYEKHNKS